MSNQGWTVPVQTPGPTKSGPSTFLCFPVMQRPPRRCVSARHAAVWQRTPVTAVRNKRTCRVYEVQRPEVDPRQPLSATAHALFTPCRKLNVLFTSRTELKPDVDVLI